MASARVSDGFTVVELLVVLAILALAMAVAGPALGPVLRWAEEPKGAEQLKAELAAARRVAIRSGHAVRFEVDLATGAFRTVTAEQGRDSAVASGAIEGWSTRVQGEGAVSFYPSGLAGPATWTWPEGTDTALIRVEPLDASITLSR